MGRVTWVCGRETVLVEEVVDHIRGTLGVSDLDYVSLTAGETSDRDIWAAVNQYPFDAKAKRLVLVRDAQRIRNWRPLEPWMGDSRTMPTVHLVFVSADASIYETDKWGRPLKDSENKKSLRSHLVPIRDKSLGELIECNTPNAQPPLDARRRPTGPSDLVAWVQRQAPGMSTEVAEYVLGRLAGNLYAVRNLCAKAVVIANPANLRPVHVDALCEESAGGVFVDRLVAMDKVKAFTEVEALDPEDYWRVIGELDRTLDTMARLYAARRQGLEGRNLHQIKDVPIYVAQPLWPYSKFYDPARRTRCRVVLAACDEALRNGAREGVMQAMVTLW